MLEDNALISRIVSRFHIIVTVVVALLGAAILGASAGEGDFFGIYVSIFVASFIAIMIALGDKFWMVIPFAFTSQLPALPVKGRLLELPEITAVLCSAVFLVRYAVKRQALNVFRREHAFILLYTGWVVMVFCLNPVGLSSLVDGGGGSLGGARFYAKILMALVAFLIMANQKITEIDCKRIILILLVGSVLDSAWAISVFFLPSAIGYTVNLTGDADSYYSWHQSLSLLPVLLVGLGFARYKASELFSLNRLWTLIGFVLCLVMIALSGKRAALASVPMFAIVAATLRREWGYLMLWVAGAVMASAIVVVGHGDLFKFPLTVQRTFSVLPAKWDSEFQYMEGGKDAFRAELRRQAWKKIEQDPWIGNGYKVDLSLAETLSMQYRTRGGDAELQAAPYAMGSAWHNTWLGYAADFGIPMSFIAALIYLSVIMRGIKLLKAFPYGLYLATMSMYILMVAIRLVILSHTSGHTALDPFSYWWLFGVQVALFKHRNATPTPGPTVDTRSAMGSARYTRPSRTGAVAGGMSAPKISERNLHT